MKTRIIQTRFWDDELNDEVDLYAQHLYLYLMTSKFINICGYFQLRDGTIKFETKLNDTQLKSAKDQLLQAKKVFFKDGWVWVKNARKNNNYENSPKNAIACEVELSRVPSDIKAYFDTTMYTTIYSSHKPKTINQKPKTINQYIEFKEIWKKVYGKYPVGGATLVDYPIKRLVEAYSLEKVCNAILWAEGNRDKNKFIPIFNNPLELERKWNSLVGQAKKEKNAQDSVHDLS